VSELRELRQRREENGRLKRLVADLSMDRQILQEIVSKRTPAAFAALHQGKASTLLGRALQSLLMEPLECAKPASIEEKGTYTAQNL